MARILIADDNGALRGALRDALSVRDGWTICGEAADGREAVSRAVELKPDVIVLDFLMPALNGIEAAAEILKMTPAVPVLLYTMHKSAQLDRAAKRVGVRKVISKSDPFQVFISALEELLDDRASVRQNTID